MNLHAIASRIISTVNPMIPVTVRISTGSTGPDAAAKRTPTYATPGIISATIAGNVLTVLSQAAGRLQIGQMIAGAGVTAGSTLIASGTVAGTYLLDRSSTVASPTGMLTTYPLMGQLQPLSYGNLRQVEGLNLGGVSQRIYLEGQVDSIVRSKNKGGDLLTIPEGPSRGVYLINVIFEQWPDWVAAGITLQSDTPPPTAMNGQLDFSNPYDSGYAALVFRGY